ncbi:MAG: glycosyltransferase family 4 protein [Candidatus Omnitrophica bacterium]|nr:glycosyltransferase family 4 protein [Candidatus Omnitrophota bacterium]MCM8771124.1 glycosyltransferase family 4 protein [Candidatus Omnitrophota bacterium]
MRKIRILYVITKLELGGAQKQLLSLIRGLDRERFEVLLFTHDKGLLIEEALSISGLKIKGSRFLERPINPLKDLCALLEIALYIKQNRIDIVHTHSSKAGVLGRLAARISKVKIILHTVHGWSFNDFQSELKRKLFIFLERICACFTHKLIVVSECDKQRGLVNNIGSADKYQLIRYGINYAEFNIKDPGIKKKLGFNSDDLVVGMVSCFKPQKAVEDFIKMASLVNKSLPETKFILVGDGFLRRKIENLIKRLDLEDKVILTGWRRDVNRILSILDVFVLTSLWEGLPVAVLEAMAAGRVVIATDTGGISEAVIEGKTGFLVSRRDMNKMSERTISLLKDENLRKVIGENAKNYLGHDFTVGQMVNKTQNLYEDLIKEYKNYVN